MAVPRHDAGAGPEPHPGAVQRIFQGEGLLRPIGNRLKKATRRDPTFLLSKGILVRRPQKSMFFANDALFPFTKLERLPWLFRLCIIWDVSSSSPFFAYAVRIFPLILRTARFLFVIYAEICVNATPGLMQHIEMCNDTTLCENAPFPSDPFPFGVAVFESLCLSLPAGLPSGFALLDAVWGERLHAGSSVFGYNPGKLWFGGRSVWGFAARCVWLAGAPEFLLCLARTNIRRRRKMYAGWLGSSSLICLLDTKTEIRKPKTAAATTTLPFSLPPSLPFSLPPSLPPPPSLTSPPPFLPHSLLTSSFPPSLTHPLTHSLIHSFPSIAFIHPFIHSFVFPVVQVKGPVSGRWKNLLFHSETRPATVVTRWVDDSRSRSEWLRKIITLETKQYQNKYARRWPFSRRFLHPLSWGGLWAHSNYRISRSVLEQRKLRLILWPGQQRYRDNGLRSESYRPRTNRSPGLF